MTVHKTHHLCTSKELASIIYLNARIDSQVYLNKNLIAWRNTKGSASRLDRIYISDFFVNLFT